MPVDLYTKAVLTLIAISLGIIAVQGAIRPAGAVGDGCGVISPCEVTGSVTIDGKVKIDTGLFGLPVQVQ